MAQQVPDLPLAVGARGADVLSGMGVLYILECIQNLLRFHSAGDVHPPIRKIPGGHDRESTTASAAVVVNTVGLHFSELRADLPQDSPLWLHDASQTNQIAGIMKGYGEVVS